MWALWAVASADETVRCTATDGSALRYEAWRKQGGAAPGLTTPRAIERWFDGDVRLAEIVTTYGRKDPPPALVVTWGEERGRRTVADAGHATTTWTTTVALRRADGAPLEVGGAAVAPETAVPMACTAVTAACCAP